MNVCTKCYTEVEYFGFIKGEEYYYCSFCQDIILKSRVIQKERTRRSDVYVDEFETASTKDLKALADQLYESVIEPLDKIHRKNLTYLVNVEKELAQRGGEKE